jgi:hypothetical protein
VYSHFINSLHEVSEQIMRMFRVCPSPRVISETTEGGGVGLILMVRGTPNSGCSRFNATPNLREVESNVIFSQAVHSTKNV